MENEILQQILNELKGLKQGQSDLRQGQAVLERDVRDMRATQQVITIKLDKHDRNQAVMESDIAAIRESVNATREAVLRIELVEMPRIQAALDSGVSNAEKLEDHERRITKLETA